MIRQRTNVSSLMEDTHTTDGIHEIRRTVIIELLFS